VRSAYTFIVAMQRALRLRDDRCMAGRIAVPKGRTGTSGLRPEDDLGGHPVVQAAATERAINEARFALAKFRPTTLPDTLVARPALHDQLTAGAGKRLTVVVGSAGAGKSVLLSSWAEARASHVTSWLSCDRADADPVRFWAGFIEAIRVVTPGFGADAADLLAMNGHMSADVVASIANDATKLPTGSVIIVDDFHAAEAAVLRDMTDSRGTLASRDRAAGVVQPLRPAGAAAQAADSR